MLDLDETLVYSTLDYSLNYNSDFEFSLNREGSTLNFFVFFRPNLKDFLISMAEQFELVLYSNGSHEYTTKVLEGMKHNFEMLDLGFSHILT